MKYMKSREEFINLISQPEYKYENYIPAEEFPEFRKLKSYGNVSTLFEDLTDKLGRYPTQNEYVFEGYKLSEAYFTDPAKLKGYGEDSYRWFPVDFYYENGKQIISKWGKFYWHHPVKGQLLKDHVKSRLSYNYISNIVELGAIATLCELGYLVGVSDLIDGVFGADIVVGVPEVDKVIYVHVTTPNGMNYVKEKEGKPGYARNDSGQAIYFKGRDYSVNHQYLLYGTRLGAVEGTQIINGNPVIRKEHINSLIKQAILSKADKLSSPAQLLSFDTWLKNNGVQDGIGKLWLNLNEVKGANK